MPEAAIVDVDGTLVDSNYHHTLAWYRAFREHDITIPVWKLHRHVGMGGDTYVAAVAGDEVEDPHRARQGGYHESAEELCRNLDAALADLRGSRVS